MEYGFVSLIPIIVVLVTAIWWRKDIEALLLGALVGAVILGGTGFWGVFADSMFAAFCGESFSYIAIISISFSALIGILSASGGTEKFATTATRLVKSNRSSMVATWVLGIALFIDDYMHSIVAGSTMKKITDRYGVSRRTLAFLSHHTAGPAVVLAPLTAWAAFFIGIFTEAGLPDQLGLDGYAIYCKTIPYMLYAFVGIVLSLLVALKVVPLTRTIKGKDEAAALTEPSGEKEDHGSGKEARAFYFYLPLLVVIAVTILLGGDLIAGIFAGMAVAILIALVFRVMPWEELRTAMLDGAKTILPATIMLLITFTLLEINSMLGTTEYVIHVVEPFINANLLAAIVFLVVAILGFCSASFWGTSALVLPIAASLATTLGANIYLVLGAIVSGAVFGSNACIFGDNTILSAASCDIQPIEHGTSQLPYCLIGGSITLAGFVVLGIL